MPAIKPSTPRLDYEPAPSRRRLIARRATLRGVLLICLAAGYWYGPESRRRIELAYWQRRCLAYVAAADQVALQTPMDRLSPGLPSYNGMKTNPTETIGLPPDWNGYAPARKTLALTFRSVPVGLSVDAW